MIITVLEVGKQEQKSKGNNTWMELPIKYETTKGVSTRVMRSFDTEIYTFFTGVAPGDVVDVKVKKEGQYWNWKTASKASNKDEAPFEEKRVTTETSKGSSVRKTGDWETAEERAKKQRFIVRQSSIANALEYFSVVGRGKPGLPVKDVLSVADQFFEYVYEVGVSPEDELKAKASARIFEDEDEDE